LQRYPELSVNPLLAADLFATEALCRLSKNQPLNRADFQRRCPDLLALLEPMLPLLTALPTTLDRSTGGSSLVDLRAAPIPVSIPSLAPGGTLQAPAVDDVLPGLEPNDSPAGYAVLSTLGRGGMGVVYQARQLHVNRLVALKMVLPDRLGDPEALIRFLAEAELAAKLQHPNVVQVYEVGRHRNAPFLALEYVAGGSLEKLLNGKPLAPIVAAQLVEQVTNGIAAAHAVRIVHRDLKPANVLLAPGARADEWVAKVSDFGLARQGRSDLTQTGRILGTPNYMPPEQTLGDPKAVGPSADIYALGAVLYECLTGKPPFAGDNLIQVFDRVRFEPPLPPSCYQASVPPALEAICLKCLEKQAENRYPSALALAEDLRRFLRNEPLRGAFLLAPPALASKRTPSNGTTPAGYVVKEEIGRDGPAVAQKARQERFNRDVVLWTFSATVLTGSGALERWRNAALAFAQNPAAEIEAVYDFGASEGRCYLATEALDVQPVIEALRHHLLTPRRAAEWVELLARALVPLHKQGIAHGNISARKLVLTEAAPSAPQLGRPKLLGFPDVFPWRGHGTAKPAADINALGMLLRELTMGVGLVRAKEPMPDALKTICLRCLQRHARRCYPNVAAVADDLAEYRTEPGA
jgi:tRNA A-37 threonylcarbamoyl transferase component Bud32